MKPLQEEVIYGGKDCVSRLNNECSETNKGILYGLQNKTSHLENCANSFEI